MLEPEVGQCDSVLLSPLSEDAFIHNIHIRFKRDIIYTYIGNVLISVNPYRQLALYSAELVRAYIARAPFQLPPHVYAVAGTAFRWLRDRNESQCIVVSECFMRLFRIFCTEFPEIFFRRAFDLSLVQVLMLHQGQDISENYTKATEGESGSGKTEAARISLQCVVLAGGGAGGGAGGTRERLTQAGTLLEAFGNAKTLRNDNASRFGKYLDIEFDYKGDPIGGHITHYLLEKTRVTSLQQGDRNFHVFYQLLSGADVHLLKCLKLQRSAEAYRILRRPRAPGAPAPPPPAPRHTTDDKPHFAFTKTALETLGFTSDEITDVFKIVAVVLKIGNIEFVPSTNIDGTVGCSISQEYELVECAGLLGCTSSALSAALRGEFAASEASGRRDQLARTLYSRLFTWLVGRVNSAIKVTDYSKRSSLSILDLYGFESLNNNGLETLLINYSNEVLQHTMLAATLGAEQEEYVREGLDWQRIPYFDNEPICHLIDSSTHGLLSLLEESHVADGGAPELLNRLQQCWAGHSHLLLQPPSQFQLRHYAGTVTYDATDFVEKNSDLLPRGLTNIMYQCRHPLCKDLFPEGNPSRGQSRRPSPLGSQQRVSLGALTRTLRSRCLHHVRCLRPNDLMRPRAFETALVQHQVRYNGLMESVLLWRSGHCASLPFLTLACRFAPLLPPHLRPCPQDGGSGALAACRSLIRALPIPPAEFAFGRTRVFIRSPRTVFELEEMRNIRLEGLAALIQRVWRGHRVRRDVARRRRAQRVIARAWKRWKATHDSEERQILLRRRWTRKRVLSMKHEKRVLWAVQTIQRHYVQWKRRRYLLSLLSTLPSAHMSPLCGGWPKVAHHLVLTHSLLSQIHHRWRCHKYRLKFDQTARNRMREKVTASIIFKDRKQSYARSVSHPFVGDYVRLRQNSVWKRVCIDTDDQYVVFADIVNKVTRSSGKLVPTLAVISTSAMLLLDQRTLGVKYRIPAAEIYRISLSPLPDDIAVFHVRASDISKKKGDFVFQTCHIIEMVTKLFLVVQNAVGKAPEVNISTEFEANFGQQTVTFTFKCYGLPEYHPESVRVMRKGNKMEVLI